ncbi:protein CHUP1, chloroplastic [Tanacetum coccineum]
MGKGKKDINLKIGLALVFSIGGMLFSFIRNRTSKSPSGSSKGSDCSNEGISSRCSKTELRDASSKTCVFDPLASDKNGELHNSMLDLSLSSKSNADKDAYLLPEFDDLMKEFDITSIKANIDLSEAESPPKGQSRVIKETQEQEINNLQSTVKRLKERERGLKAQLLEYSRLKEQETTVRELQSRLKLNSMESKLLTLKVESLQTENKRLVSQTADYNKVLSDLEAARAKIKLLKKKLLSETAQNKERILGLQERVQKMQEDERKGSVGISSEIESNLCKLKDLEAEAEELRKSNNSLTVEKAELLQKLQRAHMMDTSVLEEDKTGKLREESEHLTKQNEELKNEIEQLQADRCSDVEELVYLKWINACLRYELRNHQPDIGKTMARDLSKTLSPKSEARAKQLILEYANKEHEGEMGVDIDINIPELDSDQWSSSQNSNLTDYGEIDEPYKKNNKFFGKLVKFLRGKDESTPQHHIHHRDRSHSRNSSSEDILSYSSKHSLDSQRSICRRSDVGAHKRIDSIAETEGSLDSPSSSDVQKSELVKYAEVLKDSNQKPTIKVRRRSKGNCYEIMKVLARALRRSANHLLQASMPVLTRNQNGVKRSRVNKTPEFKGSGKAFGKLQFKIGIRGVFGLKENLRFLEHCFYDKNSVNKFVVPLPGWKSGDRQVDLCLKETMASSFGMIALSSRSINTCSNEFCGRIMVVPLPGWKSGDRQVDLCYQCLILRISVTAAACFAVVIAILASITTGRNRSYNIRASNLDRGELHNSMLNLSLSSKSNADKDAYLLPEFDDLMKEFDFTSIKAKISDLFRGNYRSTKKGQSSCHKRNAYEQRDQLSTETQVMAKERERGLKAQLLEYSRLKQQETTVDENKRLVSQTADFNKVLSDLEAARAKIKLLKKKLLSETAQNKERILGLQQRVQKMQDDECKGSVGISSEIGSNLCKLKDLEAEAEELRKSNNSLTVEKAELLQKLQRAHMMVTSVLEDDKGEMGVDIDINIPELDSDQWSSSQNSNLTDSGEIDQPYKKNNKFFGKLVKFLRGKDESTPQHHIHHRDRSHSRNSSSEDILSYSSKHSLDSQRSICRRSDVGAHKRIDSIAETEGSLDSPSSSDVQKSELVKYAEVLKDSNQKPTIKVRRRSKGFVSF